MVRNCKPLSGSTPPVTFTGKGILRGMCRLLPVSLFVVPFGVAFGIAATEQGLGPVQATVMSVLVFTATAQFAALDFLIEPVSYLSLGLVVLALSSRHVITGAVLSQWINALPLGRRFTALALLSDVNFTDAVSEFRKGHVDAGILFGGGLMLWLAWVTGTALGAFAGDLLGDTDAYGVGAVMSCFFAAALTGMLRDSSGLLLPVVVAIIVSASTLPLLPTGWNIVVAAIVGGGIAVFTHAE